MTGAWLYMASLVIGITGATFPLDGNHIGNVGLVVAAVLLSNFAGRVTAYRNVALGNPDPGVPGGPKAR